MAFFSNIDNDIYVLYRKWLVAVDWLRVQADAGRFYNLTKSDPLYVASYIKNIEKMKREHINTSINIVYKVIDSESPGGYRDYNIEEFKKTFLNADNRRQIDINSKDRGLFAFRIYINTEGEIYFNYPVLFLNIKTKPPFILSPSTNICIYNVSPEVMSLVRDDMDVLILQGEKYNNGELKLKIDKYQ